MMYSTAFHMYSTAYDVFYYFSVFIQLTAPHASYCTPSFSTLAASNMGGRPIPGPHWVEVDLGRLCFIGKIIIDWEDGYSDSWTLEVHVHSDSARNFIVENLFLFILEMPCTIVLLFY